MGNWVTTETLRQMKISGDMRNVNKIGVTVLAAPDIDIDVFKSQMRRFGEPQKPLYVALSKDDKALWASKLSPAEKPESATTPTSKSWPRSAQM
jgi:esterase/lipase superfamily enzyme